MKGGKKTSVMVIEKRYVKCQGGGDKKVGRGGVEGASEKANPTLFLGSRPGN